EGTSNTFPENLEEVLTIFGKKGTVKIGGLAVNRIEVWRFENENTHPYMKLPDPETVYGSGHIALYRDFFNSLEADKEPCITGEEGRKAVDIVLGMYLSSLTGEWVEFPFHFSTEQMGDMNKSGH
ncbi:MAG: gfo/Idh/MocA family oxidoreductase, partial [Thermotogaceae bacterium]|nr:gfo/Idh/MocA family oxidoreductase [Thermotogaceae bacterium]